MGTSAATQGEAPLPTGQKEQVPYPGQNSTHDRPPQVNDRSEGGHWEGDLMFCRRIRPLLVLVEHKSRFVFIVRLDAKDARGVARAIMDVYRQLDPGYVVPSPSTMARNSPATPSSETTPTPVGRRGRVENMNERLQQDLPRNSDIDKMSDEDIAAIRFMHNLTPEQVPRIQNVAASPVATNRYRCQSLNSPRCCTASLNLPLPVQR